MIRRELETVKRNEARKQKERSRVKIIKRRNVESLNKLKEDNRQTQYISLTVHGKKFTK
jgi:hypothetical protein